MSQTLRALHPDSAVTPNIHHTFNKPPKPILHFEGPGRTKQSFKDECDINNIMRRYAVTGVIEHLSQREPQYIDTTGAEFMDAMLVVAEAKTRFAELPAEIRNRFENDPAKLLDFVHDPENLEESIKWGFIDRDKLPQTLMAASSSGQATPTPTGTPASHSASGDPSSAEARN